jgi:hypothetical protein
MTHSHRPSRESKKQAALTPKEKKQAKRAKKDANDSPPLIIKHS